MKAEWCEVTHVVLGEVGKAKMPKRVRCPKCKRRFVPFTWGCQVYMPKHKGKV